MTKKPSEKRAIRMSFRDSLTLTLNKRGMGTMMMAMSVRLLSIAIT